MSTKRRAEKPSTAHLPQVPTAPEPKSAHRLADSQGMDARAQGVPIPIVHKKQKQIIKYEESEAPNPDIASEGTAPGIAAAATAEHSVTGPSIPCDVKTMIRDAVYHSAGATAVGGPLPCPLDPQPPPATPLHSSPRMAERRTDESAHGPRSGMPGMGL